MPPTVTTLASPLPLPHGPAWANRFVLAPLTNLQSNPDGTLTEEEIHWLTLRAEGGFGLTMTAAAYVDRAGNAWPGQLGIAEQAHLPGLTTLANALREAGSRSAVQLHHGGRRADPAASGRPLVAPFDDPETGARALTTGEVEQVVADFAAAAALAERAGFDGVELHGAHGYLFCQFLDPRNTRTDGWGGDYAGRTRIVHATIAAVRAATGPAFQVGLRISPERYGVRPEEMVALAEEVMAGDALDYLDLSLWDVRKHPQEHAEGDGRLLLEHFVDLPRAGTALAVAGKITSAADAQWCLDAGADLAVVGKGAIVDHAFAAHSLADPGYRSPALPVTRDHLRSEGLSETFVDYFAGTWPRYVVG